jgi:hypothetical protein
MDEIALIQLFIELTGDTEAAGRSVIMYLDILEHDYFPNLETSGYDGELGALIDGPLVSLADAGQLFPA